MAGSTLTLSVPPGGRILPRWTIPAAALISVTLWFLPSAPQLAIWVALAIALIVIVPLLWREGYTWVILWLAPIAAFDPVPFEAVRGAKYALIGLALGIAFIKRRLHPGPLVRVRDPSLWAALLLLAWLWWRATTGGTPLAGLLEASRLALVATVVYAWLSEPVRTGGRRRWFYIWMIMGLYEAAVCVVEATAFGQLRSYGTFPNANAMGTYLLPTIALAFGVTLVAEQRLRRLFAQFVLAALIFALYLTGARAAWLATSAVLFAMALTARSWRYVALGATLVGALMLLYAYNPLFQLATDAALRIETGLTHRPLLWEAADRAHERAPVLGFGMEAAGEEMQREARYPSDIHRQIMGDMVAAGSPHNFYRELLLEAGLIGVILFGFMVAAILHMSWRRRHSKDRWHRAYALACFGVTIGVLVHAYFEFSVFIGSMSSAIFYWFLVAQTLRPSDSASPNLNPG